MPPFHHKDTIPGKFVHCSPVLQPATGVTSSWKDPGTYHGLCMSSCMAHSSCSDVLLLGRTPCTTSNLLRSNIGECRKALPRCLTFYIRASPSGSHTLSSCYTVPHPASVTQGSSSEQEVLAQNCRTASAFPTADNKRPLPLTWLWLHSCVTPKF